MLTCVAIEDEPLALDLLSEFISGCQQIELLATAENGPDAVSAIEEHQPDLVFIDIDLPGFSGLEVLRRVAPPPNIVFTTAYDQHAITAFELGAVDYLLKPFGAERFSAAIKRLSARAGNQALERYADVARPNEPLARFYARLGHRIHSVPVTDIIYVEVSGDYLNVTAKSGEFLIGISLNTLCERLDPQVFFRANRSTLVNLDHVAEMKKHDDRRFRISLVDGHTVIASRARSKDLRDKVI